MHNIVDSFSDNSFIKLNKFVKQAGCDSIVNRLGRINIEQVAREKLANVAFADPLFKKFPCHNRDSTILNWYYFLYQYDSIPGVNRSVILNNFKKFASIYNATNELYKIACAHADNLSDDARRELHQKLGFVIDSKRNDEDYALVISKGGKKFYFYPIRNEDEVKEAASWFKNFRKQSSLDVRYQIANKILAKAEKFNITFDKETKNCLVKSALRADFDISKVKKYISKVASALKFYKIASFNIDLEKTAEKLQEKAKILPEKLAKKHVVVILRKLDDLANSSDLYDAPVNLPLPEDECCVDVDLPKPNIAKLLSGHLLNLDSLFSNFPPENILKKFFGDEVFDFIKNDSGVVDMDKFKEWAESLPAPDAKTLVIIIHKSAPGAVEKIEKSEKSKGKGKKDKEDDEE
jgi:hypothetical protein